MVDYTKVMKGGGAFLIAHIFGMISEHLIPPIMTLIENSNFPDLRSWVWLLIIIVWFSLYLLIPMYFVIDGLMTPTQNQTHILGMGLAGIYFVLAILLTIAIYFWIPILADITDTPMLKGLFWTGLILYWTGAVVATPAYQIIEKSKA